MKRILIAIFVFFLLAACNLFGIAFLGGPNAKTQKETQDAMLAEQNTQQAFIQTQVSMGMTQVAASRPSLQANAQAPAPQANPANAEQTSAAKTAQVAEMLTSIALTPSATFRPEDLATPKPELKPVSSDGTDFSDAKFYAWGQWDAATYGITIELKGTVGGNGGKNFIMKVDDKVMNKCFSPLEYPNRLQCTGKPFQGGKKTIQVLETVDGQEVLLCSLKYTFPSWTITPTRRATKTPDEDD